MKALSILSLLAIAALSSAQQVYPQIVAIRPLLSGPLSAGQNYSITANTATYGVQAKLILRAINTIFQTREVDLTMDFEVDVRFYSSQVPRGYVLYLSYFIDGGRSTSVESSPEPPVYWAPNEPRPPVPGVSADAFALGPVNAPDPDAGEVFLRTWNDLKVLHGINIGLERRAYVRRMYVDGDGYLRGTAILSGVPIKAQVKASMWDSGDKGSVIASASAFCRFNLAAWYVTEQIPSK